MFGYRFQTPDRSIVISGDTSPAESIVEQCNGCDMLIHEVYTEAGYAKASPEWSGCAASTTPPPGSSQIWLRAPAPVSWFFTIKAISTRNQQRKT